MALITCPECAKSVSDKAPACPGCGAPIAGAPVRAEVGVNLTTTQETSKSLKARILLFSAMFWLGLFWVISLPQSDSLGGIAVPSVLSTIGLIGYIITKAMVWWHHK